VHQNQPTKGIGIASLGVLDEHRFVQGSIPAYEPLRN
jgi:hypothetical protein